MASIFVDSGYCAPFNTPCTPLTHNLLRGKIQRLDASEKRSQGSVHMDAIRGMAAIVVMLGHSRDLFFQSVNGHTAATTTVATVAAVCPFTDWKNRSRE